jgi:chemotaxis protein methyltransferase CheR
VKQDYFKQEADGRFTIDPHIKQMVQFAPLNLAQSGYPSFLNKTVALDVIFCRNVLMYFAPKVMQEIIQRFYKALAPGGWLIVSPSEASHLLFSDFLKTNFPGTILYQKPEAVRSDPPRLPLLAAAQVAASPVPGVRRLENTPRLKPQPVPPEAQAQPEVTPQEAALALARKHANQGQLAEALDWCHKAITLDKLNPGSHYLLATILAEQGQVAEAIKSLKRSLYLDPDFVLAHFTLGNLIQQQAGAKKAGKHFQNALSLLAGLPPDESLPEAEGMTAGRLVEVIQKVVSS